MKKLCITLCLLLALTLLFGACAGSGSKTEEDDLILVEHIDLLNTDATLREDGTYYATVTADENGVWRYRISYCTFPENANDRSVSIMQLTVKNDVEIDEANATVTIKSRGIAIVKLQGKDGSEASLTLYIAAI